MKTYRVSLWTGKFAAWPMAHAVFQMPASYEPWHLVPDWMVEQITELRPPRAWLRTALDRVGVEKLDELNIFQAASLLDVLLDKTGGTRATGDADHVAEVAPHRVASNVAATERLAVDEKADAIASTGRWKPRRISAPLTPKV